MSEYASEAAASIARLADMMEYVAGGLFAIAAAAHTDDLFAQRQMAAVLAEDARTKHRDPLRKLNKKDRAELESYIRGLVRGK